MNVRINFKEYIINLNASRARFRLTLPNIVGILLISVAALTLAYSYPVSMFLNTQVADAAIPPSHVYIRVLHTPSPQLVDLRFFPSSSYPLPPGIKSSVFTRCGR